MPNRVATITEAAAAFRTFAEAEGAQIPMYSRLCAIIAERRELHGLLLDAPVGQRLPVLLLAALHDIVLREPDGALAPWYPSVSGAPPADGDPTDALLATVDDNRDLLAELLTTRTVQTNEVNRCVGWHLALRELCDGDDRPLALIEIGASAGLNLRLDDYAVELDDGAHTRLLGRSDSTVRLAAKVRPGEWPGGSPLPDILSAVGLDERPLDVSDPDDARWLEACVWPEQRARFGRLRHALRRAVADPRPVHVGDAVQDVTTLIELAAPTAHVVVLSSWVLAYLDRAGRSSFLDQMVAASSEVQRRGGRLSLLTLEADHLLDWVDPPPMPADAPAEVRHSSTLAITRIGAAGVDVEPLARCQAHLAWVHRISP